MSARTRSAGRSAVRLVTSLWLIIAIVLVWYFLSQGSASFYVPQFPATVRAIGVYFTPAGFQAQVLPTVANLLAGFVVAVVVGVALGIAIGRSRLLGEATAPIIGFVRSVPPPALLPIAIALLGIGAPMRIGLIAFGAVWPTLLSTIDAVRNMDPGLDDIARVYSIRRRRRLLQMVMPAAAPMIVAGMRTSLLYSITLIVLSEMAGASAGLGHSVLLAQRTFQIADMWAAILMLGLLGLVLNVLFLAFERTVLRWHITRHTERGGSWIS
ncbi:ABC transporter permease [Microbacterium panaciterrae]|uniref:ABC transporter permease n=1 Tax=Microbacterium panaciterrae TaxID=985759 RepID=A0ABP8PQ47_9MICO